MNKIKKVISVIVLTLLMLYGLTYIGGPNTMLSHQIKINASKDQVFATLANLESVQHYNPTVVTAKYISDNQTGIGAARECNLGKDGIIRERVTGFEQGQSISMELYHHNWPLEFMRWTTHVESVEKATLVTQTIEYKLKFGLIGSLLDKLMMKNKLDTTMNTVFDSMKLYIEKQTLSDSTP